MNKRDQRREAHRLSGLAIRHVLGRPELGAGMEDREREGLVENLREMAARHEYYSVHGKRRQL